MKGLAKLKKELLKLAKRAGGSTITQEERCSTAKRLAAHLHAAGYPIQSADSIRARHVESYAAARSEQTTIRTMHNELAHIRTILHQSEKDKLACSDRLSNERLLGEKASREPAREAPDAATRDQYIQAAEQIDEGVGAVMRLLEVLGLRAREAVQGAQSLGTWEEQLLAGERVTVVFGTKGGRPRDVNPVDRQAALRAVRVARAIAKARGGRLIESRSGSLRAAMSRFSRIARQAGARGAHAPHSFRYSFARERMNAYREQGYSEKEARALTSQDLGHGDGRGSYIKSVYARDE